MTPKNIIPFILRVHVPVLILWHLLVFKDLSQNELWVLIAYNVAFLITSAVYVWLYATHIFQSYFGHPQPVRLLTASLFLIVILTWPAFFFVFGHLFNRTSLVVLLYIVVMTWLSWRNEVTMSDTYKNKISSQSIILQLGTIGLAFAAGYGLSTNGLMGNVAWPIHGLVLINLSLLFNEIAFLFSKLGFIPVRIAFRFVGIQWLVLIGILVVSCFFKP